MTQPQVVWPLTKSADGKERFAINEHINWLRKACTKTGMTHYDLAFQPAISELRRTLKVQVEKLLDKGATEQLKMRKALDLDDEDDEGLVAPSKKRKTDATEPVRVDLDGNSFKMMPQTVPLLIEATPDATNCVIAFVKSHISAGNFKLKRDNADTKDTEGDRYSMPPPSCQSITGKVTWHPSRQAWAVHLKDATGRAQTKRVCVEMIHGPCGPKDNFDSAREKAYYKAIHLWNADDKSTRGRI